jgi:hypothetical protein
VKLKLDENRGTRTAQIFADAGHDVSTVTAQELRGVTDDTLYGVCTAGPDDRDARPGLRESAPLRPEAHGRDRRPAVPTMPTPGDLDAAARTFLAHAARHSIHGRLWIVRDGRVRQYEPRND